MGIKTKIQWCDSTVNPTMGCEGCELWGPQTKNCYAGTLHARFGGITPGYAPSFEEVTLFPGRVEAAANWPDLLGQPRPDKPWLDRMPRLIFVSDMGDSLSKVVTFDYLREEVIAGVTSEAGARHRWLWLTKRPDRMAKFSDWLCEREVRWPDNLWAGTSVTTQARTSRIGSLLRVGGESTVRFVSVEPQLGYIDLEAWLPDLDWVIQGGESGRARIFDIAWAAGLIGQCRRHGVPLFLKQLGAVIVSRGERVILRDGHGGDWSEWPEWMKVRQLPMSSSSGPGVV